MSKTLWAKFKRILGDRYISISEWQLDVAAVIYIVIGIGIGLVIVFGGIIPRASALEQVSITFTTDVDFGKGILTDTEINGTGSGASVRLEENVLSEGAWMDSSWLYRKRITFNNAAQAENLTNFPVAVILSSSNFDFSKAKTNGEDIRFTDSNGTTTLSYEIERWDNPGQSALIWVKVPQVDSSSTTDGIFMYYGNTAASDSQNAAQVWSNGYAAVWHYGAVNSSQVSDSTGNGNTGTLKNGMTASNVLDAKLGKGLGFDGSNDYVEFAKGNITFTDGVVEAWVQRLGGGTWFHSVGCGIEWEVSQDDFHLSATTDCQGQGAFSVATPNVPNTENWHHYAHRMTGAGSHLLVDGQVVSTVPGFLAFFDEANADSPTGGFTSGSEFGSKALAGYIDELRVSSVVRSNAWMAAQYSSMNNTMNTFGSEQVMLQANGNWESPTNADVIDLVWNSSWGDGTGGSTAFSANIANVGVNSNITFQMRVAQTLGALSGASYSTLGVANSGTTFTRTASQLDSLGLNTGNYRYAQIKITFTTNDGATNPQVNDFSLNYMSDDTDPEANASNLTLQKFQGGASVSEGDWTNNLAPYFTWSAATDTQSGIRGYCVYLGADATGDPVVSKGLLGTSPSSNTGLPCQFVVNGTSVDFATMGYRGGTWLTSSNSNYYINIKAVVIAGNIVNTSLSFSFKFDNTPPSNPAFLSLPSGFISTKDATFTWPTVGGEAASDAHSGFLGLQYRVTAVGTWYGDLHDGTQTGSDLLTNDGSYSTNVTYDYPLLSDGTNVIYIRTWDNAGNVSVIYTTGSLKINTSAPSAPRNLTPTPAVNSTNSYAFDWDQPLSFVGSAATLTYCYTVNVLPSSINCSFTPAGQTLLAADAFANQPGDNTIYVVARDEASNINYSTYASAVFNYNGTAPGIPTNIDVSDISVKASNNWRLIVSWNPPSNVGAGISYYRIYRSATSTSCSAEPGSFISVGTTPGISYSDSDLTQQNYYYCVRACDTANNCSALSETRLGYPDGRFTEPANLVSEPVVTALGTRSATVNWATDRQSDTKVSFGLSTGQYFEEEPAKSQLVTNHEIRLNNLQPGTTYFFRAKWLDEDGNLGQSEEKVFTTLAAPVVTEATVSNIGLDRALLSYTTFGAASVRIHYGTSIGFGGLLEVLTSTTFSNYTTQIPNLSDTTKYFYKINPVDNEGFEYEGTILDFTTLPKPRVSNVQLQEVKGEAVPTVEISWNTNTLMNSIVTYYPEGQDSLAKDQVNDEFLVDEHKIVITDLTPDTNYIIIVKGRDKFGNQGESELQRFTTGVDSRPARIFNLLIEGAIVADSNNASEESGAQLIISWDTDEPSTTQVEYGEGTGAVYIERTQKDTSLSFNHLVVISKLQPSQVYHLRAVSSDAAGNESTSVDTVTITPKASQNAIEVVLRNLGEIFSFLR